MDLNHTITFWNHGAEEHYGWSESEALGQVAHTLLQTLFPYPLDEIHAQLIRAGRWEGELEHTRRDGSRIIVTSRWVLQRNRKGEPNAILETNTDVTERKRAQDQIRQLNAELEQRVADRTAKLETANEQLEELNAQLEEEIAERKRAEEQILKLNQELEQRAQALENANEELQVANEELRVANEDLQNEMLERERAEFALRLSEERFRFALANSPVIVGNLDRELRYTWIYNPVSDLKPADVVGRTVGLAMDPETQENIIRLLQDVVANGTFVQWETVRRTAAVDRVFESHAEPLRDAEGEITGVAIVSMDITDRKHAEDEIRRLNQALQQHAQDLESMNEELEASNEELRVANEDLGREIAVREQAEQALRNSEGRYRSLFENLLDGFAYCQMLYDDHGRPVDFVYLDVNAAFETLTGLKSVVGKKVTEVIPGIKQEHPELFDTYGRVAWTGQPERFALEFKPLAIWLSLSVYSPERGYFIAIFENITERKNIEQALVQTNSKLSEVLDSIQDDFYVLDHDWKFVYTSRQFTSRIGKKPADFVGNCIWEMFPEHVDSVLYENFHAAMDKREIRRFEVGGKYTDAWYAMTCFPSAEGITVLGTDITERKQTEEALRRQSELLQLSFDAIIVWRLDGGIESWNRGAAELYGFTEGEALGRTTHELLQTTHPVPWLDIETELRSKGNWEGELRHRTKDGRQVIVSARHQIVCGVDGVERVLETNRDITERKRAEEALRDSQTRFQALVETTSDFIWETDARGMYTYCSPQLQTLWGLDPKEMIGKSPFDLLLPQDREQASRAFSDLAASRTPFRDMQVRSFDATGSCKFLEVSGVPFFDAAGNVKGFRGVTRDITERKQMELELQDAAAKYSTLFDTTSDGIWIHNLNGEIVEVNDAYCRMSGYSRDELTHMPISTLEAVESPEEIAQHIQKLLKEGGHDRFESRHRRKDGSIFDVDITALYLERAGGRIAIFARDITKRKQAEAALRRRTAELQAVMEAVPTAVFITRDPDSRTISGNRAARELVELPPSANISKSAPEEERPTGWQEMRNGLSIAPEDLPLQLAARGQEVQDYEMDLVFRDGTVKSVLSNATPLWDEQGKPQGGIAVMADVTERKRAEEALKRQSTVLEGINRIFRQAIACETEEELGSACLTIVEQMTGSQFGFIGEMNAQGRLDDIAISDPGWDACQMEKRIGHRIVPGGFEIHGLYGRVLRDGKGFYTNDPASHPDHIGTPQGHPPLTAFLGAPLKHDEKTIGMVGVGNRAGGYREQDLLALESMAPAIVQVLLRQRTEHALREAMDRIQRLNEDLEQRAGELEVANEELEQLATSLALDLRSPLVSLRSVSRLIAQDYGAQLPPPAQRLFHLIEGNGEEMEQLTQGLHQLMRVTRQTLRKQELVPEEIVRTALAELQPECAGRQVEIAVGPLPTCHADPLLLKQVWLNLLSNALKFTRPREQARIEIGARSEGNRIVYFVKDNGVGFDMSYAGTIFRAFQRYHHAEEWGGAGVGLAMVESIVRRHGGRVWAEGVVNEGATFYFTLG